MKASKYYITSTGKVGKFCGMVGNPPNCIRLQFVDGYIADYLNDSKFVNPSSEIDGDKLFGVS